jgi:hypothetical protein
LEENNINHVTGIKEPLLGGALPSMAAELQQFLVTLDLEQHFLPCLQAGIQTWEAFINVTEPEFDALHIRRGHRRRIQREIARRRLWPDSRPLPTSAEQLRQYTQDLRRMSRGIGSEHIEESFYALRSFTQSPWSSTSSSTESEARSVLSTHEKSKTIRQHVADLLRPRESDPPAVSVLFGVTMCGAPGTAKQHLLTAVEAATGPKKPDK